MANTDTSKRNQEWHKAGYVLADSPIIRHPAQQANRIELMAMLCMMRILQWELVSSIDCNRVIDASYFYSAFDKLRNDGDATVEEVHEALADLAHRRLITFTFPDPEHDPEGFIVRLAQRQNREEDNV